MTAEESEQIINQWNTLHNRVTTLLELGEAEAALKVVAEMEQLPFELARDVAYDSSGVGDAPQEVFGERIGEGGRVHRKAALDEAQREWARG